MSAHQCGRSAPDLRCRHLREEDISHVLPAVNFVGAGGSRTFLFSHRSPCLGTYMRLHTFRDHVRQQPTRFACGGARVRDDPTPTTQAV